MFQEIVTDRLALRDLEPSDGPRVFSYHKHPEVSRFQSWGTESVDAVQSYIRSLSGVDPAACAGWYQVGIFLQTSCKLIGDCGFRPLAASAEQVGVGITVAPEYQGQGYASEALRALLNFLFAILEKHRVIGSVDPRNVPSIKLLQQVGMRQEGHFVKSLWFRGEWVDDVIFAMLASEWKSAEH